MTVKRLIIKKFLGINPLAVLYWFFATVLVVRGGIFFAGYFHKIPAIYVDGLHMHHFATGYLILLLAVAGAAKKHFPNWLLEGLFGVALGLIFDEFIFWTLWRFDYWSMANFFATVSLSTVAGNLSRLHPRAVEIHMVQPWHTRHHIRYSFWRHLVMPWAVFVVVLWAIFIFGNPVAVSAH